MKLTARLIQMAASGRVYEGDTATALVKMMKMASPFTCNLTNEQFMADYARRASWAGAVDLKHGTPDEFVADLLKRGLAKEVR